MMKPAWALNKNLKLHSSIEGVLKKIDLHNLMKQCFEEMLIQWKPM